MNWLSALAHLKTESIDHVLLTVLDTRGSSPRNVGTKMVVSSKEIFDTIGGGALEHQTIEIARDLLTKNSPQKNTQYTKTFNLGKDLKQCCGGVVSVLFEIFPVCNFTINIFGAGHIGQALSKILNEIDCKLNIYDSREDQLQQLRQLSLSSHVKITSLDKAEIIVEECEPNSYYLVTTHDHALDQQLCEAILSRGDSAYCGVIGSRTKGIKFRQRLNKKGFSSEELNSLTCPMGLSELKTKKPMEIAVSILTELLVLRDNQQQNLSTQTGDVESANDPTVIRLENRD